MLVTVTGREGGSVANRDKSSPGAALGKTKVSNRPEGVRQQWGFIKKITCRREGEALRVSAGETALWDQVWAGDTGDRMEASV